MNIQNYPRRTGRTTKIALEIMQHAVYNDNAIAVFVTHNKNFADLMKRKIAASLMTLVDANFVDANYKDIRLGNGSAIIFMTDDNWNEHILGWHPTMLRFDHTI